MLVVRFLIIAMIMMVLLMLLVNGMVVIAGGDARARASGRPKGAQGQSVCAIHHRAESIRRP
jgi:hypothetical protein